MVELIIIGSLLAFNGLQFYFNYLERRNNREEVEKWSQKLMAKTHDDYMFHQLQQQELKNKAKKSAKSPKIKPELEYEPDDEHLGM